MAKDNSMLIAIAIVVAAVMLNQGGTETTTGGGDEVDLCKLIQGTTTFNGQNMYIAGTAVSGETVKIYRQNGDGMKEVMASSSDGSTYETAPSAKYLVVAANDSGKSAFYANPVEYTAPCQEGNDDLAIKLCTKDNTPTVTVFDEFGNVQSANANSQAMTTSDEKDLSVRVRVSADQCYGNPSAPSDLSNAICFYYNTSTWTSVEMDTGSIAVPYNVSSTNAAASFGTTCYKLDVLSDNEQMDYSVKLTANDVQEPDTNDNITIFLEDIAYDLDADTLEPIWGYFDEDNNELGVTTISNAIQIRIS